jgi:diguanylate cyclase (GGDEF)-like protein
MAPLNLLVGDQVANAPVIGVVSIVLFALVVARMMGLVRDVQQHAHRLNALAVTDALTGLANRRSWEDAFPARLDEASRRRQLLCVALIDLDHFKAYNDTFGHAAGDELLCHAGMAWKAAIRHGDLIARYGGEEFAALLPGCALSEAIVIAERLRCVVPYQQSCSVGLASWDGSETATMLMRRADIALYQAKSAGRNRVCVAEATTSTEESFKGVRSTG